MQSAKRPPRYRTTSALGLIALVLGACTYSPPKSEPSPVVGMDEPKGLKSSVELDLMASVQRDTYSYRILRRLEPTPEARTAQGMPGAVGADIFALKTGEPESVFRDFIAVTQTSRPSNAADRVMPNSVESAALAPRRVWSREYEPKINAALAVRAERYRNAVAAYAGPRQEPDSGCVKPLPLAQNNAQAWDNAYRLLAHSIRCRGQLALFGQTNAAIGSIEFVEPNIDTPPPSGSRVPKYGKHSSSWPFPQSDCGDFWYRCKEYSQLDEAFKKTLTDFPGVATGGGEVLVAHLDTGYPIADDVLTYKYPMPPKFDKDSSADCFHPFANKYWNFDPNAPSPCLKADDTVPWGVEKPPTQDGEPADWTGWNWETGFFEDPTHGAGTLSILGGGYIDSQTHAAVDGNDCRPQQGKVPLGAYPCARVFEVRVGPSFVHLGTEALAAGIYYAAQHGADVISLSHGGLPSGILEEAVNFAYDNGTPIFSASGDYLGLSWLSSPKMTVFPARFSRVMNVTGVDADNGSAGVRCLLIKCIWSFGDGIGFGQNFRDWLVGTNYGPTWVMQGHSVAAFTPNVANFSVDPSSSGFADDEVGTSASVPQVAAAAAMWLERNSATIPRADWRTWKKTEGVYRAVLQSACDDLMRYNVSANYSRDYFGAGILSARLLVSGPYDYRDLPQDAKRKPSTADLTWWIDAVATMTGAELPSWEGAISDTEWPAIGPALGLSTAMELRQLTAQIQELQDLMEKIAQDASAGTPIACALTPIEEIRAIKRQRWSALAAIVGRTQAASSTLQRLVLRLDAKGAGYPDGQQPEQPEEGDKGSGKIHVD